MSAKRSGDATLRDATRALALLSTDAAAVKGLQAVIRAGRRQGLDSVQFAGVTLTSAAAAAGPKHSQQQNDGGVRGTRDQAEPSKRSRRKSQAQRERDAEKFRDKRMRKKLFPHRSPHGARTRGCSPPRAGTYIHSGGGVPGLC